MLSNTSTDFMDGNEAYVERVLSAELVGRIGRMR